MTFEADSFDDGMKIKFGDEIPVIAINDIKLPQGADIDSFSAKTLLDFWRQPVHGSISSTKTTRMSPIPQTSTSKLVQHLFRWKHDRGQKNSDIAILNGIFGNTTMQTVEDTKVFVESILLPAVREFFVCDDLCAVALYLTYMVQYNWSDELSVSAKHAFADHPRQGDEVIPAIESASLFFKEADEESLAQHLLSVLKAPQPLQAYPFEFRKSDRNVGVSVVSRGGTTPKKILPNSIGHDSVSNAKLHQLDMERRPIKNRPKGGKYKKQDGSPKRVKSISGSKLKNVQK